MVEKLDIERTEFNRAELARLVDFIPKTDPRSGEYSKLLENIERYLYFANIVAGIEDFVNDTAQLTEVSEPEAETKEAEIIPFNPPVAEEEKFDEPEAETVEYEPAVVKSLLSKARSTRKIANLTDWINENFGVSGFTAIPAKRYPEVMAKLKELGMEVE